MSDEKQQSDTYDRLIGTLEGLPDVTKVKPSTIRTTVPLLGMSQTFIVQTIRQRERGDHIFLETLSRDGSIRIALPPQVADAIARQRDALTAKTRSATGKRLANERKERGEQPGFMKNHGGKKRARKK